MKSNNLTKSAVITLLASSAILLNACSMFDSFKSDGGIDYKSTVKQQTLEVPPDLTKPATNESMRVPGSVEDANTYSAYLNQQANASQTGEPSGVMPQQNKVRFEHQGANSWLVIQGDREQIWPSLREFWLKNGFVLVLDNKQLGIMETEWAENRANIPKGFVRSMLSKVFAAAYNSGTRDKFRLRVERVPNSENLELFITHRGMVERVLGGDLSSEGSVWERRPSDPELEAEILKRLMVHLGIESRQAESVLASAKQQQPQAELVKSGDNAYLQLPMDFSQAWRQVGLALDRVSFTVVDRNRSDGIYFVQYSDPDRRSSGGGMLSKLKFWEEDKPSEEVLYQVTVKDQGENSQVVVNNNQGQLEKSSTGDRILNLLHEQLK